MRRSVLLPFVLCLLLSACAGEPDLGPPEGWTGEGADRWWMEGTDTATAFRDLETLEAMGVTVYEDVDLGASVQNRMIELYRTNPALVDSLFAVHGLPVVREGAADAGDRTARREQMVTAINHELARYYRQPLVKTQAQTVYPDSLREAGVGGQVVLQVYVDDQGAPLAVEKVEGAHPTLDALTMQMATQTRWTRPWVITDGQERYVPGWTRLKLTY